MSVARFANSFPLTRLRTLSHAFNGTEYTAVRLAPPPENEEDRGYPMSENPHRRRLRWYVYTIAVLVLLFAFYTTALSTRVRGFDGTSLDCPTRISMAKMGLSVLGESSLPPPAPPRDRSPELPRARQVLPKDLLSNDVSHGPMRPIPKIIHQTYKTTNLPKRAEAWVDSIRLDYPDWQWVLWTDDDNEELVQKLFPQLLDVYRALPRVIYRVDFVRWLCFSLLIRSPRHSNWGSKEFVSFCLWRCLH
jgi:hypothetical protein